MITQPSRRQTVPRPRKNGFLSGFAGYKKQYALCLMLLPTIVYFVIFKYVPMAGLAMAFKDFKINAGIWGSPWVEQTTADRRGDATVPRCRVASSSQLSPQPQALGLGAAGPVWARSPPVHHPGPPSRRSPQPGC